MSLTKYGNVLVGPHSWEATVYPFHTTDGTPRGIVGIGQMPQSFNYRLTSIFERVTPLRTAQFLEHPTKVFNMFKISASDHHNASHRHSLSLVSTTTIPLYMCLRSRPSISFR